MKYQKIIVAVVVLSAVFWSFSPNISIAKTENVTAKCRILSFDEAFEGSTAVFVGKVVSDSKSGDIRTFEFEVEKYWKGVNTKKIKINVYETMRFEASFKTDEKYLIYASADDAGKLEVGRCSRSRNAAQASEDLKKLGAGKTPA